MQTTATGLRKNRCHVSITAQIKQKCLRNAKDLPGLFIAFRRGRAVSVLDGEKIEP